MLFDSLISEALALDENTIAASMDSSEHGVYAASVSEGEAVDGEEGMTQEERESARLLKNREHAKNSRLRKKTLLQNMESRLEILQYESFNLKVELERQLEKHASHATHSSSRARASPFENLPVSKGQLIEKIKQFVREEKASSSKRKLDDANILSNTESACFGLKDGSISSAHTSESDLVDKSKKERNKEHAKLARDRKKLFVEKLRQTISNLEETNNRMRMHIQFLTNPQDAY